MLTAPVSHPRRGLTLLELVVVLTILVAIGALLVPLLPNMVHRANIASCVVNIPEMDKLMQTYFNTFSAYPDKLDNLCIGAEPASYVADGEDGEYGKSFVGGSLETTPAGNEAESLKEAGITQVCPIIERPTPVGDWKPTFWPYSNSLTTAPVPVPIDSADLKVATLNAVGARLMGLPYTTNYKYVIFGVNAPCTLFRNLAAEPAYHFADTPKEDPATYYMCLGVVFAVKVEVTDALGAKSAKVPVQAKYMGCVAFHDFGLSTAGMHTKEWWERLKGERPLTD
jgi:type II secretory pathway pseudopilin PulG